MLRIAESHTQKLKENIKEGGKLKHTRTYYAFTASNFMRNSFTSKEKKTQTF